MDGEGTEDGRAVYREEEGDKTQEIAEAAQTIAQGESSSCKEEVKGLDALTSILCRGSGTEHELLERIGTTISISALHAKYKNLEDARLAVYDLAQKVKGWRAPYFRYRCVTVRAYRSAVQLHRRILMMCYIIDILAQQWESPCDGGPCMIPDSPCNTCRDAMPNPLEELYAERTRRYTALGFDEFPGHDHPDIIALEEWYSDEIFKLGGGIRRPEIADAAFIGTYPFSESEDNDGQKE